MKNKKQKQMERELRRNKQFQYNQDKKCVGKGDIKSREKIKEETLTELYSKKTSPKTLELQKAKTAKVTIELIHDCITEGTYSNPERQEMKRERLHEMKPKRKARWERSLVVSTPPVYKMKKGKLKILKLKKNKRLDI